MSLYFVSLTRFEGRVHLFYILEFTVTSVFTKLENIICVDFSCYFFLYLIMNPWTLPTSTSLWEDCLCTPWIFSFFISLDVLDNFSFILAFFFLFWGKIYLWIWFLGLNLGFWNKLEQPAFFLFLWQCFKYLVRIVIFKRDITTLIELIYFVQYFCIQKTWCKFPSS